MDDPADAAMHAYDALGGEQDRLGEGEGVVEFERTREILLRHLPAPPAVIADIGGGPGRYAGWLAGRGPRVEPRDLVPLHSVDAVLLLGPLYHLRRRGDRVAALAEARRVVRPGGPVFVAAISRWAPRLAGELRLRLYEELPAIREESPRVERTGFIPPLLYQSFTGYCHRPGQLRAELRSAGLEVVDLVGVEGLASR